MTTPNAVAPDPKPLRGVCVLAAINGLELFGNERDSIAIFEIFRDLGARVVVGVNNRSDGGAVAEDLFQRGFTTFPLPFGNQWSFKWLRRYPVNIFEKLREVISCSRIFKQKVIELDPAYIYLSSPLAYSFLILAMRRRRLPLIYRAADLPPTRSRFNMVIWRSAIRRSKAVISISKYVADQIGLVFGPRLASTIRVIYGTAGHPVPVTKFDVREERIVYVGQLTNHKGVRELLEAFSRIAGEHPRLHLDIVGGSPLYGRNFTEELRQDVACRNLQNRVAFHGYVANPSEIVGRALFQIVPTVTPEPLGLVVLEAKMSQTPTIVFPTGGLPEMVRHQIDGYVCTEPTVPALVAAMNTLLSHRERLPQMGAAAVADFQQRFSATVLRAEWASFFVELGRAVHA